MDDNELIRRYSIASLKVEGVYAHFTKKLGMDESEWTILYALYPDYRVSQKEICDRWMIPTSTINTTVKHFRELGYCEVEKIQGKRRELHLYLTEKGKIFAKNLLEKVFIAEKKAIQKTLAHYGTSFVEATEQFADALQEAFKENN